MKLGMIDYGRGNLRSVINACRNLGYDPVLVTEASQLEELTHVIFPGQGAFGDCMESLNRLALTEPLREWILAGKPYFGICVGYQLLFEESEESPSVQGLGILSGKVQRFTSTEVKIPHMGWNSLALRNSDHPYWAGLEDEPFFYFVHSFYPVTSEEDAIAATCDYGEGPFCAAIQRDRLLATQFHPEKSQHAGLQLLKNFLEA